MNGVEAEELTGLAGKLRGATDVLDSATQPSPLPNVGEAARALADSMAMLTGSTPEDAAENDTDAPGRDKDTEQRGSRAR
ncbi:hypothetical protein [Actinopolyspora mortivallis]|nr:hypothetical protein [Actinopolyspora mortivallis]